MKTAKKILFLDFDGVLHPTLCGTSSYFCEGARLHRSLSDSSALELVISSSWRFHHSMNALRSFLPPDIARLVVGVTPHVAPGRYQRFREIRGFLESCTGDPDWRALDDSAFEFPLHTPELILCDGRIGMDERIVSELRIWLASPEKALRTAQVR